MPNKLKTWWHKLKLGHTLAKNGTIIGCSLILIAEIILLTSILFSDTLFSNEGERVIAVALVLSAIASTLLALSAFVVISRNVRNEAREGLKSSLKIIELWINSLDGALSGLLSTDVLGLRVWDRSMVRPALDNLRQAITQSSSARYIQSTTQDTELREYIFKALEGQDNLVSTLSEMDKGNIGFNTDTILSIANNLNTATFALRTRLNEIRAILGLE